MDSKQELQKRLCQIRDIVGDADPTISWILTDLKYRAPETVGQWTWNMYGAKFSSASWDEQTHERCGKIFSALMEK